ncbi:aminoglycoside 3'-phosphotransferase [Paractinoplanes ferrugineus]|uniref:Phosphotransferase n=1 Tax=Paractinoplanes ferrugineus TaxID=113564 RepID=A0A919IY35_9ACTN|nr:aminoglycoside 3'-phosphotransferase [Actinoplanes ferrugineus]GIE11186.1 putative phosphotransferase [Actinoplanes ferrugineus]
MAELTIVHPPETAFGEEIEIPAAVRTIAAGRPLTPVWRNVVGGLTYRIGSEYFVKFAPASTDLPLAQEAERLRWAARYVRVPEVVASGSDETGVWLQTRAINGWSAVDGRWRPDPATAVTAIAEGLRELHTRVPVEECPFDWSVERRLAKSPRDLGDAHPQHRDLDIDVAWERATSPPPIDRLVVCHGDACAPNTLLGEDGRYLAHVDLAALGVADRWADLAIGSWSLSWNFGAGWEDLFFRAYGIDPDPERIAYYRLLWDLGS